MQGRHPQCEIHLTDDERATLEKITRNRTAESCLVQRARIVLISAENKFRNTEIGDKVGCSRDTVRKWRIRFQEYRLDGLKDDARSGRPPEFSAQQRAEILAMATRSPQSEGKHFTDWSLRELANHVVQKRIVKSIGWVTISRWLKDADIKPHKWEYWLNSRDPDFKKTSSDNQTLH